MCQTRGSKADGSSEGGVTGGGGDRRKGKRGLMTKVMDWKDKKLKDMKPTDIRINFEGFTLSEGLIFKAQFDVRNPLSCAMPKWKSIRYSLKIAHSHNLNFPDDSDREIAKGEVPSKWLKAKETTRVYVTINVSLEHVGDKLKEIILQTIINGLLKVELEITISFPIMGGRPISHKFQEDVPVSLVLENCLSPKLYKLVQMVLGTIEGNKNKEDMDIPKALFEILEALSHYCDDKKEALALDHDHVADDMKKNWEQIKFTIESIQKYLKSREFLDDLNKNWKELKNKFVEFFN